MAWKDSSTATGSAFVVNGCLRRRVAESKDRLDDECRRVGVGRAWCLGCVGLVAPTAVTVLGVDEERMGVVSAAAAQITLGSESLDGECGQFVSGPSKSAGDPLHGLFFDS